MGLRQVPEDNRCWGSYVAQYFGLNVRYVAYDLIGHCYYIESGSEENNEVSFNLGAH